MSHGCAHCDGSITAENWHPVTTVRDDEGEVEVHAFCCADCRAAWRAERD
jgi:hypothetical protein